LLARGVEIEQQLPRPPEHYKSPRVALARRLVGSGEVDRARTIFSELETHAAEQGDEGTRGFVLWRLGVLEWFAGRWQEALELAAATQELAEQAQLPYLLGWACELRADVETDLGLVEQARGALEVTRPPQHDGDGDVMPVPVEDVLGRIEFALGNLYAAVEYLRPAFSPLLPEGCLYDPTSPAWADLIEALIGLGELDEARIYLARQELQAARVRGPWALAVAARGRGLLALAEGDLAAAFESLQRSLRLLEDLPYPFERGRTLLSLGSAQRRARQLRAARQTLAQAQAVFEHLGARLWVERARAEQTRISGRRAAYDELTDTELRVATLAAEGLSNKQIASTLIVSVRTVEAHLYRVYRKLGVRSRTALSRQLAADTGESEPPKLQ
jgi:ATP/maltotriose-dependent transcriptional regulator MalT